MTIDLPTTTDATTSGMHGRQFGFGSSDDGRTPRVAQAMIKVLSDLELFSRHVLKVPLYAYQLDPARAIMDSIIDQRGDEILLIMSRQSGKNETVAQLLVYMLNILQRAGGNIVFAAIGDGIGRGIRRLEEHLDNDWNFNDWKREARPTRRTLGKASVVFMSSHPQAHARGETAHYLLVIDELQDQDSTHLQAVFQPMRAARNATAVYLGTVRTTQDALWRKKEELERAQQEDGRQRVWVIGPEAVTAENPQYDAFLKSQIAKFGRRHPIIACEYFLEPLDTDGGLFPLRRLKLMRGGHKRQEAPENFDVTIATLDVAGIDEGTTEPTATLDNPARDYTVCTIHTISHYIEAGPVYTAVDVFIDQGTQHFEKVGDRPSLAEQLLAYLEHWNISTLIADATGVGEGLANWLNARLGGVTVQQFKFTRASKAQLGVDFLALVETNRFKYFAEENEFDDAWWFFEQANLCTYELPAGKPMERYLKWYVPATTRVDTPTGGEPVHDDRLISAALIAEADKLLRDGKISVGRAESVIGGSYDPIEDPIDDFFDPLEDLPDW
jgi:hypothetical protein